MEKIAHFIESHSMSCFYQKFMGIPCPGCGFQRSLVHLLRGEVYNSISDYPALIPTLIMIIFLVFHLIFKLNNGARILLLLFSANVVLMLGNYVFKIFI